MPTSPPLAPPLAVAVMGAGAVGCYYGGMLARAGHAVTLIGRPDHVNAIRLRGLRLETQTFDETVAVQSDTDPAAVADAGLVLFCVKSTDTASAAAAIAPHLDAGTLVLTLQNGVDNDVRLRGLLPQPVLPAVVYVATAMAGPGHVRHHGRGELVIGPSGRSAALAATLAAAGVPTTVSDNVRGALWAKLVVNCAYNALSAITRLPYGALVRRPGIDATIAGLVAECRAVAAAEGIVLPGDLDAAVRGIAGSMAGQVSSTAQDLMRGRRSEIDHLNGHVVARGDALGVATPLNRTLLALVKALENPDRPVPATAPGRR
ncbi:2-dehydropantoate 2-reductase [Xylophilus sp. Kf1]|nr:2-dehydropantoate 2-reductase [Xylophilus sp. Kf1]